DLAPAGWTTSGSLIFGANMRGRLQMMALRSDGDVVAVHPSPEAEVPLVVLGESIVFGRFPNGERTIPRGEGFVGRVFPTTGELLRLDADGVVSDLGPTHGFLSLICAGDRAPPCLLVERTSAGKAVAFAWDPETGRRGREVARWPLSSH